MANLFERPIAANPLSEFVGLPLELLNNAVQRRQQDYEKAKATIDLQRDTLLSTTSSMADKSRHSAILQGFEESFESIADEVGGDYSLVRPRLDSMTRKIKQELHQGELGSIHKNAGLMSEYRKDLEERYSNGKTGYSGYKMGLESIGRFKTDLTEKNSWSSFHGYNPSPIADVFEHLDDAAKKVQAKFMADGNKIVSTGDVQTAMGSYLKQNPAAVQALQEEFQMGYKGDPKKAGPAFQTFLKDTLSRVASFNVYQEVSKKSDAEKEREWEEQDAAGRGIVSSNWAVPGLEGSLGYAEGGASYLKALGEKIGLGTTDAHKQWVKSAEGRQTIKALEQSSNTKFPTGYLDQVNWIQDNAAQPLKANLEFGSITDRERKHYITEDGKLTNPSGAVYRKGETSPLSAKEKAAMLGDGKGPNKPYLAGVLRTGVGNFTRGSTLIIGADGLEYVGETTDPRVLNSPGFNLDLLKSTKYTNTGSKNEVTLRANIVNEEDGKLLIPVGTYKTERDPTTGYIKVKKNGVDKYIIHTVYDKNGNPKDNVTQLQ